MQAQNEEISLHCGELQALNDQLEQQSKETETKHHQHIKKLDEVVAEKERECVDLHKQLQKQQEEFLAVNM